MNSEESAMELRPYQQEAIEALERHFAERDDNPCVVLPTGSGKSYVIAEMIRRRIEANPSFHCIVLAHRQELVAQNRSEFINLVGPDVDVGINCARMGMRNAKAPIIFAMINSVHHRAADFPPVDMVVVDEAHHIPMTTDGMYREFLSGVKAKNPRVRVVGFTATPYRLGVGHVCHKDYVLNKVCYEANVGDLIEAGYLCRLRSKISKQTPNLEGVSECGGDYNLGELSNRVCVSELVRHTVRDALSRINAEQRRCCVWFCVDVKHCEMVRDALSAHGETVGMVTGKTPSDERRETIERFRQGGLRHLLNVAVFTEGFNVKQVDAIVLLRPTLSRGLYVQMVGRGLRLHPDKRDCIVLDYARCIQEHGPIDQKADHYVPMEICSQCEEYFPRAIRKCPTCGCELSEEEVQKHDADDEKKRTVRKMHDEIAACREILAKDYGCVGNMRVVNKEWLVKVLVMTFAYETARAGYEYKARHNRTVPTNLLDFKKFLNEFMEYASCVELTNLPDMLQDYFEKENLHYSEFLRMRRERRREEREELDRKIEALFLRQRKSECPF